jgi:hypothetical protein
LPSVNVQKNLENKGAEMPGGTLWRTRQLKNSHHL